MITRRSILASLATLALPWRWGRKEPSIEEALKMPICPRNPFSVTIRKYAGCCECPSCEHAREFGRAMARKLDREVAALWNRTLA